MKKDKKRPLRRFGRALLPPARFHSTKRGKRGYLRRESREEERRAWPEENSSQLPDSPRTD